jgi:leucyl-tRNA synthetase
VAAIPLNNEKCSNGCSGFQHMPIDCLTGLDKIDWSESLKDIQRYWIGKSEGADIFFDIKGSNRKMKIFTTRPDTIYGVTFMVLAPESELVDVLTTSEQ